MPTSPPGNVFPALVVVGHIVTLIAVWQWRIHKKQGKKSRKTHRYEAYFWRDDDTVPKFFKGLVVVK